MTHDLRVHNNNIIHFITEIHFTVYRSKKNLFAGILLCCKGFPISIRKQIKPVMKGNYLIFKIFKKRNFLQWKRLNIDKLVLQSCLDLIERSVYREPNPRTENSPSPPMTTKTSQIANGLAELSFPLTQTPFFNTELPPTHPLSGLVLGYLLAPGTKQDDHAQPHPNPQILFSSYPVCLWYPSTKS